MLKHRLILGAVFIALLVGLLWLDGAVAGGWIVAGLVIALVTLGSAEFAAMWRGMGYRASAAWTALCALAALGVTTAPVWSDSPPAGATAWALAAIAALSAAVYARCKDPAVVPPAAAGALLGSVYLGVLPAAVILLRDEHGAWMLLGVLGVIKSCDIGAYFVGCNLGRHKLIPWLSPAKTWEGLVGGVVTAAVLAAGLSGLTDLVSPVAAAGIGAALGLAGQAGDLFESLLKRSAGVKDSGRMPGFGGVLDLLDSPLAAVPVAWGLLRLAG